MPQNIIDGQQIVFKDYNGYLNNTNMMLLCASGATVEKSLTHALNTAGITKRYVYWSAMTDFISI